MKKNKLKGVLVNTKDNTISVYELDHKSYKDFYPLINCSTFDIVVRKFDQHYLDVVCDDEGLFTENNPVSIFTFDRHSLVEQIVGSVFICSHNDKGELISLTEEQIKSVERCIRLVNLDIEDRKVLMASL